MSLSLGTSEIKCEGHCVHGKGKRDTADSLRPSPRVHHAHKRSHTVISQLAR